MSEQDGSVSGLDHSPASTMSETVNTLPSGDPDEPTLAPSTNSPPHDDDSTAIIPSNSSGRDGNAIDGGGGNVSHNNSDDKGFPVKSAFTFDNFVSNDFFSKGDENESQAAIVDESEDE